MQLQRPDGGLRRKELLDNLNSSDHQRVLDWYALDRKLKPVEGKDGVKS